MDFSFFNALLTNTYESYLHGYYISNYFDNFIDKLPVRYRNLILTNQIVLKETSVWDSYLTPVTPSRYWNNSEEVTEDNAIVAEFYELLDFELIRIEAAVLRKGVLAWRLGLISSGNSETIKAEYRRLMLQLPFYEAEIQNAVHLKPYCSTLMSLIEDIRNDVSVLKVYYNDGESVSDVSAPFTNDSLPRDRENKFNQVPLNQVKAHFEILTTQRSKKNNKPHLTKDQLDKFIEIAFLNDNERGGVEQKLLMNCTFGELQSIRRVFYEFYENCKFEYESTRNSKEKYVRLLTDYFEGFGYKQIANNFDKK